MSIEAIRFRAAEAGVILQVLEAPKANPYDYNRTAEWRDAKVEDLLEVARYTRVYDALDRSISELKSSVGELKRQSEEASMYPSTNNLPNPNIRNW